MSHKKDVPAEDVCSKVKDFQERNLMSEDGGRPGKVLSCRMGLQICEFSDVILQSITLFTYDGRSRPRWSRGNVLASRSNVRGFKPD